MIELKLSLNSYSNILNLENVAQFRANRQHEIFLDDAKTHYLYENKIGQKLDRPFSLLEGFDANSHPDQLRAQLEDQQAWIKAQAGKFLDKSLKDVRI